MQHHDIALLPGDGIGPEVIPAAVEVLEAAGGRHGVRFRWTAYDWGCEHYTRTGSMMPPDGLDQLAEHDQILLGAVGWPGVPDDISLWGLLIPIRRHFHQYVNLRPMRRLRGLRSPVRPEVVEDMDLVVVRENNEGEYSEIGGRLYRGAPEELAVQESVFTRRGVTRVVRFAFELAQRRSGALASATKSNGIVHTMPFWDQIVRELATEHPDVELSEFHIDALAARFVLDPGRFDVVVASNLFGDILSDLSAGVAGSIGLAPSANLNPEREHPSMFEPVHGSAPDIAGRGIANPIGAIWSGAMMLEHLGHADAADEVVEAIEVVLEDAHVLTPDLGGTADTAAFASAVAGAMSDIAS